MFKKIASSLGLTGVQAGEGQQEINFFEAMQAHNAWKKRLLDYVEGNSTEDLQPSSICKDNLCPLGKWIYGSGQTMFGEHLMYRKLVDEHAKFHEQAAKVVEAHQAGDEDQARQILAGDFEEQSRRTVFCLAKLNAVVEEHNQKG